jgi:hypothetical protein
LPWQAVVLIWLNGGFGVGKTTTGELICQRSRGWRTYDPELVGSMLEANLLDRSLEGDFQHLAAWRRLVPRVARELQDFTSTPRISLPTT